MWAMGCVHSLGLRCSGSGSGYSTKVQTQLGLRFEPIPDASSSGDHVLGTQSCPQLKAAACCLPCPIYSVFWVCNGRAFSGVFCVSSGELISVCNPPCNVGHPESQKVLVSNEPCLQFGIGCLSGVTIAPFWLWLPLQACGMGQSTAS